MTVSKPVGVSLKTMTPGLLAAAMSFQLPEDGKAEDSKSNCIIL